MCYGRDTVPLRFSPRRRLARRIHLTRVTRIFQKRLFAENMARPPLRSRRRPWGGGILAGGPIWCADRLHRKPNQGRWLLCIFPQLTNQPPILFPNVTPAPF